MDGGEGLSGSWGAVEDEVQGSTGRERFGLTVIRLGWRGILG